MELMCFGRKYRYRTGNAVRALQGYVPVQSALAREFWARLEQMERDVRELCRPVWVVGYVYEMEREVVEEKVLVSGLHAPEGSPRFPCRSPGEGGVVKAPCIFIVSQSFA